MPARSCVIIVENLPVPFDRRVWQEALALKNAGWKVSVICPSSEDFPAAHETIESIAIYRYALPIEARGKLAFLVEYASALYHTARLLWRIRRERGFTVIQACNPPDVLCLAVLPFKLMGAKFVFDQHDLSPELYRVKFQREDFFHKLLLAFERLTYRLADQVVTANDSFREIAIRRGGKRPEDVEAVYSLPSAGRIYRGEPDPALRQGVDFVIGYLGIIGDQDGVDHLMRAVDWLLKQGVSRFRVVVVGAGPALPRVRALARELGVERAVQFTGYRHGIELIRSISAFDFGVIPDPVNVSNDLMSMNKVFEYCALGIPTVSYRLSETMRLLGDAGVYADTDDPASLGAACLRLMNDPELRATSAVKAAALSREKFVWANEERKYVNFYERLIGRSREREPVASTFASEAKSRL